MPTEQDVRIEQGAARHLVGIRKTVKMAEAPAVCPKMWADFSPDVPLPGQASPVMYGVNDAMDMANGQWDYMVAVEVKNPDTEDGRDHLAVAPATYAVITHHGPASNLGETYQWIYNEWLPASGKEMAAAPGYERYGPGYDKETMSGDTEIWIPLKV